MNGPVVMHRFEPLIPIRGIQWVFWIILLGLTAYLVHTDALIKYTYSPSYSYTMFVVIWTFIALVPLTMTTFHIGPASSPSTSPLYSYPLIGVGLEALTAVFWFASFIAVAVYVSHSFGVGKLQENSVAVAKAAAVFGAFEWLAFTASSILVALTHFGRARGAGRDLRANTTNFGAETPKPSVPPEV